MQMPLQVAEPINIQPPDPETATNRSVRVMRIIDRLNLGGPARRGVCRTGPGGLTASPLDGPLHYQAKAESSLIHAHTVSTNGLGTPASNTPLFTRRVSCASMRAAQSLVCQVRGGGRLAGTSTRSTQLAEIQAVVAREVRATGLKKSNDPVRS